MVGGGEQVAACRGARLVGVARPVEAESHAVQQDYRHRRAFEPRARTTVRETTHISQVSRHISDNVNRS